MDEKMTASERGYADCLMGNHLNPFDWERESEDFRAWIDGYTLARALQDLCAPASEIKQ